MDNKELEELSRLAQIEVTSKEAGFFLATFEQLENALTATDFRVDIEDVVPMERILTNCLELHELSALYSKHQVCILSRSQLGANATLNEEGKFVLPKND